jgi:hypothetical protein
MENKTVSHEIDHNINEIVTNGSKGTYSVYLKRTGEAKQGG